MVIHCSVQQSLIIHRNPLLQWWWWLWGWLLGRTPSLDRREAAVVESCRIKSRAVVGLPGPPFSSCLRSFLPFATAVLWVPIPAGEPSGQNPSSCSLFPMSRLAWDGPKPLFRTTFLAPFFSNFLGPFPLPPFVFAAYFSHSAKKTPDLTALALFWHRFRSCMPSFWPPFSTPKPS